MANGVGLGEIDREIALHHARWKTGDNPIWRLSPQEQRRRLGATAPLGAQTLPAPLPYPTARVPAAFDYRNVGDKNYITSIRDQGGCGSCVAFGCIAAIEGTLSWQQKHNNPTLDLSEAQLFFCYGSTDGANCAKGYWPAQALPHCVNPGLVDEACFPYTDHDQSCSLCADWKNRLTKIRSFQALGSPADMKGWISTKGPIVTAFDVYNDFFAYRSGVYKHVSGPLAGGHCVSIVGYDDAQKCWKCKNSWGPLWGEHGFFQIEYGDCRIDSWGMWGVE